MFPGLSPWILEPNTIARPCATTAAATRTIISMCIPDPARAPDTHTITTIRLIPMSIPMSIPTQRMTVGTLTERKTAR